MQGYEGLPAVYYQLSCTYTSLVQIFRIFAEQLAVVGLDDILLGTCWCYEYSYGPMARIIYWPRIWTVVHV